jgi:hypothetical protein
MTLDFKRKAYCYLIKGKFAAVEKEWTLGLRLSTADFFGVALRAGCCAHTAAGVVHRPVSASPPNAGL